MDNKDFEKRYQNTFNKVHASDELLRKVKNTKTSDYKVKFDFRIIPTVAACLVVAILGVILVNPFGGNENSFVLKAGAAEIGGDSPVAIANVSPSVSSSGSGVEGLTIPFAVYCDGNNIVSVKYTIENAVFAFPFAEYAIQWREVYPQAAELSDKAYDKAVADIKVNNGMIDSPQYNSYTLSYEDQRGLEDYDDMQSFPIHISAEISTEGYTFKWIEYFDWDRDLTEIHEDEELFNEMISVYLVETQQMYNDMFDKVRVIIEVTYEDGTTENAIFKISCIRANEKEGFIMGAQLVDE